jgi:hypothetical protein
MPDPITVYQTDAAGYYTGPVIAQPSPREPDRWLIPAGATTTPPPNAAQGMVARLLQNGTWVVAPVPPATTPQEPPPVDIEDLRATTTIRMTVFLNNGVRLGHLTSQEYLTSCLGYIPAGPLSDAVDQLPEPDRTLLRGTWARGSEIDRMHPGTELIRVVKGMTPEQMDQVFGIVSPS